MKRVLLILCVLCLLLLCACTSREQGTATTDPNIGKNPGKDSAATTTLPPASGTDLFLPETLTEEAQLSLDVLRSLLRENDALCGIAFIAHTDPQRSLPENIVVHNLFAESSLVAAFPFVAEITADRCVGEVFSDMYCLVPTDPDSSISIELLVRDNESGEWLNDVERELFSVNDGAPILLSSQSNGWGGSNVRITVSTSEGKTVSFQPALLSNTGTVNPCPGVFDFSAEALQREDADS